MFVSVEMTHLRPSSFGNAHPPRARIGEVRLLDGIGHGNVVDVQRGGACQSVCLRRRMALSQRAPHSCTRLQLNDGVYLAAANRNCSNSTDVHGTRLLQIELLRASLSFGSYTGLRSGWHLSERAAFAEPIQEGTRVTSELIAEQNDDLYLFVVLDALLVHCVFFCRGDCVAPTASFSFRHVHCLGFRRGDVPCCQHSVKFGFRFRCLVHSASQLCRLAIAAATFHRCR